MVGRLNGTWALLLALVAGNCLYASIIGTPKAEFQQTYSLNPNGRVVIQNLYGDVRITAWDRDEVLVQAIKKSRDPRQLEDARIVVDSSNELLSIRTQYAGADAEHPASVEYRITVPRTANLENVRLVNGGLSISGLAGSIKASSVNGSIRAERLGGQVDLSTVNGHLDADFNRVSRSNSISLSSVNGPINLSIPSGAGVQLFAHNLSGGIDSDFGHVWRASGGHRLRTTVNRGGAQIHLNNVNGGISIRGSLNRRIVS
ncbi:MAG: DUF4097 domain-containing protein [Acidobacteriia bacterium]|nr:DUF4097 domain-containing protein [Terriglobia bacterium]